MVIQLTTDSTPIREFISLREAAEFCINRYAAGNPLLTEFDRVDAVKKQLRHSIKGRYRSTYGFKWSEK